MKNRTLLELFSILLITGFIVFFNLGGIPLLDPDEPVYAETAKEMIGTNDFISPRIYGDFWYDKPPMYYWLTAASFTAFGQNEFAARFPSATLAVFCSLFLYFSGRKLFNNRTAFFGALILATSIEYLYLAKAAVTDITLTFFLTVALLSYLAERYYLFYIGMALAVVTKGPVGVVIPAAIIFVHLLVTQKWSTLRHMKILSGGVTFLVIALPWYVAMYHYHGTDFTNTFLGFHNVTRFLEPEHPEGKLWYYYVPVLFVGFFPWIGFLGQACYTAWQKRKTLQGEALLFLLIWAGSVFGFFSLSQTKLISYILPMYPALAMLVGTYLDQMISDERKSVFKKSAFTVTLFTILLEAALLIAAAKMSEGLMPGAIVNGFIFAAMLGGVWLAAWKKKYHDFVAALVAGMVGFVIILMTMLFPAIAPDFSVKHFAETFEQCYDGQAPVYVAKFYRPGFMFYTGISGQEIKNNEQIAQAVFEQDGKVFLVVNDKTYQGLAQLVKEKLQVQASENGKVLLLKEAVR